jgi:hypothetical protein
MLLLLLQRLGLTRPQVAQLLSALLPSPCWSVELLCSP